MQKEKEKLNLFSDQALEKIIGYSITVNKHFFSKDLINAVSIKANPWDKQSFIYGLFLGDAYINRYGAITLNQGWKQKGFLTWKYLMLKQWNVLTNKSFPVRVINFNKKRNKYYVSYRFNTKSLFKIERNLFFPLTVNKQSLSKSKKALPLNFEEIINAQVLALWFMDDGGLGGNTALGLVLDVSAFTTTEQVFIQQVLDKKFHLKTSLHIYNKNKNHVKLYFKKESVEVFKNLIKPYIVPSLKYKIKC